MVVHHTKGAGNSPHTVSPQASHNTPFLQRSLARLVAFMAKLLPSRDPSATRLGAVAAPPTGHARAGQWAFEPCPGRVGMHVGPLACHVTCHVTRTGCPSDAPPAQEVIRPISLTLYSILKKYMLS